MFGVARLATYRCSRCCLRSLDSSRFVHPAARPARCSLATRRAAFHTAGIVQLPTSGEGQQPVLRSYSLSGLPDAAQYRISVKLEPNGEAGTYFHTRAGRRRVGRGCPARQFRHCPHQARTTTRADECRRGYHARAGDAVFRGGRKGPGGRCGGCMAPAARASIHSPRRSARCWDGCMPASAMAPRPEGRCRSELRQARPPDP
jgi:hypothetical protein